jgi:Flp pilus assembly protein TadD
VDKAIDALTTATRLQPDLAAAHFALGTAYERKGESNRALAAYRKAQALSPSDPRPYNNIAWIIAVRGLDLDEALSAAKKAYELAPNVPAVVDTLGFVHYKRREYELAEPLLRKAAETAATNAAIQYHLGMTYYSLGKLEDAGSALRRALQLDERLPEADEIRRVLKKLSE